MALAESPAPETGGASVERIQLRRAVDSLPERLRTVVILKAVEGYSHGEIAELLGISRGASEVRLSRALARLREGMGDHDAA
ncbi:MAG TPA: sigma-70 family RNA polymerase sigma factor [Gemmatimonadales bacterium]|nr:sigma-70 family RNA polymerase sigma factor [Gemmatimonadales bacterium]